MDAWGFILFLHSASRLFFFFFFERRMRKGEYAHQGHRLLDPVSERGNRQKSGPYHSHGEMVARHTTTAASVSQQPPFASLRWCVWLVCQGLACVLPVMGWSGSKGGERDGV
ncbi:hypothetical protein M0657_001177 [Pyricularia oryzae]|nr:hypothetical protein M0657_001177 [Pyricularia oryzae]